MFNKEIAHPMTMMLDMIVNGKSADTLVETIAFIYGKVPTDVKRDLLSMCG